MQSGISFVSGTSNTIFLVHVARTTSYGFTYGGDHWFYMKTVLVRFLGFIFSYCSCLPTLDSSLQFFQTFVVLWRWVLLIFVIPWLFPWSSFFSKVQFKVSLSESEWIFEWVHPTHQPFTCYDLMFHVFIHVAVGRSCSKWWLFIQLQVFDQLSLDNWWHPISLSSYSLLSDYQGMWAHKWSKNDEKTLLVWAETHSSVITD